MRKVEVTLKVIDVCILLMLGLLALFGTIYLCSGILVASAHGGKELSIFSVMVRAKGLIAITVFFIIGGFAIARDKAIGFVFGLSSILSLILLLVFGQIIKANSLSAAIITAESGVVFTLLIILVSLLFLIYQKKLFSKGAFWITTLVCTLMLSYLLLF